MNFGQTQVFRPSTILIIHPRWLPYSGVIAWLEWLNNKNSLGLSIPIASPHSQLGIPHSMALLGQSDPLHDCWLPWSKHSRRGRCHFFKAWEKHHFCHILLFNTVPEPSQVQGEGTCMFPLSGQVMVAMSKFVHSLIPTQSPSYSHYRHTVCASPGLLN